MRPLFSIRPIRLIGQIGLIVPFCCALWAEPLVVNPSFETDHYGKNPGYARTHDGITGWQYTGNAGINPWWIAPAQQKGPQHSFTDNGLIPDGRQAALLQNECTLSQRIEGFEADKTYRVTYSENARVQNAAGKPPQLEVTLGGETVVSLHALTPVERLDAHSLPYDYVESATFTAPADGAFELVFRTTVGGGVTVLLDHVQIAEVKWWRAVP